VSIKYKIHIGQAEDSAYEEQGSTFYGNTKFLTVIICSCGNKKSYTVKNVCDIPVPSWDVTLFPPRGDLVPEAK
jgi:hypothetical protein